MSTTKKSAATQAKELLRQLNERDLLKVVAAHMRQLDNDTAIDVLEEVALDIIRRSKNYVDNATDPNAILDGYRFVKKAGGVAKFLFNGCFPYSVGYHNHAARQLLENLGEREFTPEFALEAEDAS